MNFKIKQMFCCILKRLNLIEAQLKGDGGEPEPICTDAVKVIELTGDVLVDQDFATLTGYDPATMMLQDVYLDHSLMAGDGPKLTGNRDGIDFELTGTPDVDHPGALKGRATLTC